MHCGKIISVAISFLKNASLPGLFDVILKINIHPEDYIMLGCFGHERVERNG